eukprot:m.344136 g.344136  ORF g.344136 m.344136 type:complete len:811 (-) comp27878_c0_seq1:173-2605(-)
MPLGPFLLGLCAVVARSHVDTHCKGGRALDGQQLPCGDRPRPPALTWAHAAPFISNTGLDSSVPRPPFGRLPTAAQAGSLCPAPGCPVRPEVWAEGLNGAGLYLGFATNATAVWLNATLSSPATEDIDCSATCGSGLDMYAWDPSTSAWRYVSTTTNSFGGGWSLSGTQITRAMTSAAPPRGLTRYRIHLPIYNGLTAASIGVTAGSQLHPDPASPGSPAPILFYGTSIVNGHVASRPGMIFTAQLSRLLARPVVNLGFGANGKMEPAIGAVIAEMQAVELVAIDCNYDMNGSDIEAAAVAFVHQLRATWSGTKPIVLAEGSDNGAKWIVPTVAAIQQARRAALAAAYANLTAAGVANLHYVKGEDLIGTSGFTDIPTAMGTHPTDLGHAMIAAYYAKELPPILAGTATPLPPTLAATTADQPNPDPPAAPPTASGCNDPTSIEWTVASTSLTVGGRAAWDGLPRENYYDRFPLVAKGNVTSGGGGPGIWGLSKCPTGMYVEFAVVGGSVSTLYVNYSVADSTGRNPSGGALSIMPPLGRRGVDLYGQAAGTAAWVWAGNFGSSPDDTTHCGPLNEAPLDTAAATRFMLYLPLWRACSDDLAIGISAEDHAAGARLVPSTGAIDATKPPIVWYGTSILHGAAVTRAGESFSNRVSRGLNRTVLNFGFSGSGHMDTGIGLWLTKIDAAVYIIDCLWNMNAAEIALKAPLLVRQLRAAHPTTPIVLAEGTPAGGGWFGEDASQTANNRALQAAYTALAPSDTRLFYVNSSSLFAPTGTDSPTVGGCHPSDLGAHDVASYYVQFLPSLLTDHA